MRIVIHLCPSEILSIKKSFINEKNKLKRLTDKIKDKIKKREENYGKRGLCKLQKNPD